MSDASGPTPGPRPPTGPGESGAPGGGVHPDLLDVDALRADTPGTAERIHLNNAGAGLMPRSVLEAAVGHLRLEAEIGGYEAAAQRREGIAGAYESVGRLVGAPAANIAFMENATAAFSAALSSIPFRSGDCLVTTRNDYVSNQIAYLSLESRFGVEILRAPDLPEGGVDVLAMEELIHRRRPRLVAMTHVPTSSGLVQPVEAVGRECRKRDIPFLVDACQSVGQLPVDVGRIECDFLSATARKFLRGPRGAGFLFVSDRVLERGLEPLFPDLRGADWVDADLYQPAGDARRFENWEFAYALVLATGEAARYALEVGLEAIESRCRALAGHARERLRAMDGIRVLDRGAELCAIVSVAVEGWDASALVRELGRRRINTSATERAYAVLDFDDKGVESTLRVSPHYYNTVAEVDALVDALAELTGPGSPS